MIYFILHSREIFDGAKFRENASEDVFAVFIFAVFIFAEPSRAMLEPHPYQLIPTPKMRSFLRSVQDVHASCKFQLYTRTKFEPAWYLQLLFVMPKLLALNTADQQDMHDAFWLLTIKFWRLILPICIPKTSCCQSASYFFQTIAGLQSRVAAAHQQFAQCHSDCWCMALIAVTENCRINSRLTIRHNGLTGWQGLNLYKGLQQVNTDRKLPNAHRTPCELLSISWAC